MAKESVDKRKAAQSAGHRDIGCSPTVIQPPKRHNTQVDIPTLLRIADSSTASGSKNFKVFPPSVVVG